MYCSCQLAIIQLQRTLLVCNSVRTGGHTTILSACHAVWLWHMLVGCLVSQHLILLDLIGTDGTKDSIACKMMDVIESEEPMCSGGR